MDTTPYWWTTGPYAPNPPLADATSADVAIIGGGFTGLSTAYHLKKLDPSLSILVIEADSVGFGASGRNGGFGMTLFGMALSLVRTRFGDDRTREAHRYMERAVDHLWEMVQGLSLDCDAERPGFLRVATTPAYERALRHEIALAERLGLGGISWLSAEETRERVHSDRFLGAWWEPRCVLLNPAKLAREMKRVVERQGVRVVEDTPVTGIRKLDRHYVLETPGGTVKTPKIAFATNAYSDRFPMLRARQVPVYTYIVLTEPLGDRLESIGWRGREGVEDARNLIHYFRLTADNRLLMGGGDVALVYANRLEHENDQDVARFRSLGRQIAEFFPHLTGIRLTHAWGGPVSVTVDLAPTLGYLGSDRSAVYSVGCIGHGVSMTQYNGWTLAELLLERDTERTQAFFVNRWTVPWPPEPLRLVLGLGIRQVMRWQDRWHERGSHVRHVRAGKEERPCGIVGL